MKALNNMQVTTFNDIKSGDLLIWSGDDIEGKSQFYLKLVRFATMSDYGHISIAWRKEDSLYHVEATQPYIDVTRVNPNQPFYHIPMPVCPTEEQMLSFFEDKIGLKYSFVDAVCGYLGITLKDRKRWQCVELCNHFYKSLGLDFGEIYVPNKFIKKVMAKTGRPLVHHSAISI